MISVVIFINGNPIMARSATRRPKKDKEYIKEVLGTNEPYDYLCDDGTIIKHVPHDGAISLAKKMLDTIKVEEKELNIDKYVDNKW